MLRNEELIICIEETLPFGQSDGEDKSNDK